MTVEFLDIIPIVGTTYVEEILETLIKAVPNGSPSKDKQGGNLKIFKLNNKETIVFQTLDTIKHTN